VRPARTHARVSIQEGTELLTGDEARHPPGTRLGGAPRGGPQSGQQQTLHNGTRSFPADAACLGWPWRGGAS
jgi:hypothetical protein